MKKKSLLYLLPFFIVIAYIFTLFNWQVLLPAPQKVAAISEQTFIPPKTFQELQNADPAEVAKLPTYDGRKFGIETEVKDQIGYSLCWAFATAHAIEASVLRKGVVSMQDKNKLDVDPVNIAFNRFNLQEDPLGNTWESATGYMEYDKGASNNNLPQVFSQWRGLINRGTFGSHMSTFDYTGYDHCLFQLDKAVYLDNASIPELKQAVVEYGAFTMMYRSQYSWNVYYNEPDDTLEKDHVCSVIGWDDTISKDLFGPVKPKKDGAWIVKNSWGTKAGENGYFYLSYESSIAAMIAYDFSPAKTYDNNYFYDLSISTARNFGSYTQNGKVDNAEFLQAGNIFEVKKKSTAQKEFVKAVNVGLEGNNINCEVQVYTGLNSLYDNPTSGKLAASKKVKFTYGGYYTIDLDNAVDLDGSNYFSIVVKVDNPTKDAAIAAERDYLSNYDFCYVYNFKTKQWENSKDYLYASIPRIKAYTINKNRTEGAVKSLEFATVDMQVNQKRVDYNEQEQNPDFRLLFEDKTLQKDVDYVLTYKNNQLPGVATAIYTGINNYSGTKQVYWTIVKSEQPVNIPGTEQAATGSQRHFTVAANITNYNQIPLPSGWRWTYPNDAIKFDTANNNYVQYADENYNRTMWPVTVHRATNAVPTINIATCTIDLQGATSYKYTGSAIQPKVTVQNGGDILQENSDYILQYANNVKAGVATVKVIGIGAKYSGEKSISFTIEKENKPASKPEPVQEIAANDDLSQVNWGRNWRLYNPNESIAIGETKYITLIRTDADNYLESTCVVLVTRTSTISTTPTIPNLPSQPDVPNKPQPTPPTIVNPDNTITLPDQTTSTNTANKNGISQILIWIAIVGGIVGVVVGTVVFIKRK